MSRAEIIDGMAEILWATAWADHVEEARCCSLSGCEITEIMPTIPKEAHAHAERIALDYETLNGWSLETLYQRALDADTSENITAPENRQGLQRFGNCLAFQAMGAGVSWFDDHAVFELKEPYDTGEATADLMYLAEKTCEDCKPKRRSRKKKAVRA